MTNQRPKKRVLANAKGNRARLEEIIPEVFCDVFPLCTKVLGYTKDGTVYNLKIENGKNLAQAILDWLKTDGWVKQQPLRGVRKEKK